MLGFVYLAAGLFASAFATPIIYDGRAPFNLTNADLDTSTGPFLTIVKGPKNATHYDHLFGHSKLPTPLWNEGLLPREQVISISIDNSSIFLPGTGGLQFGFRRTDIIAAENGEHTELNARMETNKTIFHVSIQKDELRPLNYSHEYQIVFIEPSDGSQVFKIQLGTPFENPAGPLPGPDAHHFKVRDHALNLLFSTPFTSRAWHNFAVEVDWNNRTLAVWYSQDDELLHQVVNTTSNPSVALGPDGKGDYHFTILKLPLANPADPPSEQDDVPHHGIQEGDLEGLFYSGVFVESAEQGISRGRGVIQRL